MAQANQRLGLRDGHPKEQRAASQVIYEILFWLLVSLLIVAPLPFGSSRPLFWGMIACYVGVIFLLYLAVNIATGRACGLHKGIHAIIFGFYLSVPAYLAIQIFPLPDQYNWLEITTMSGETIHPKYISLAPGMTFLMLMRHLAFGLFGLLMLKTLRNTRLRLILLDVILFTTVGYAVYAMIALHNGDTVLGMKKDNLYAGFATGTYLNRNTFATLLAMSASIAVVRMSGVATAQNLGSDQIHIRATTKQLVLYFLAFVFLALTLVSTGSRMGQFAATAGCVVGCIVTLSKATRNRSRLVLAFSLTGVCSVIFGAYYYGSTLFERLLSLELSAKSRLDVYIQTVAMIWKRPITGYGGGSFEIAYPLFHELPADVDRTWDRAHNTYLSLWSDLGIIIGSVPIILVLCYAVWIFTASMRSRLMGEVIPQASAIAAIVVVGIHSLVDFSLEIPSIALIFVALVSCGASTIPSQNKRKPLK